MHYAPIVLDEETAIFSYPSLETEISCKFDANPPGTTTLTAQGKTENFEGNSALLLITAQEQDFPSTYTCSNENKIGKNSYQINLKKEKSEI